MVSVIDLRPIHHRIEDRVRADVIPNWLIVLMIRITEGATGQAGHYLGRGLGRVPLGTRDTPQRPNPPTYRNHHQSGRILTAAEPCHPQAYRRDLPNGNGPNAVCPLHRYSPNLPPRHRDLGSSKTADQSLKTRDRERVFLRNARIIVETSRSRQNSLP